MADITGSFHESVHFDGSIGDPDILGYYIDIRDHGYGDNGGRVQLQVALPYELVEQLETEWRERNLTNDDASHVSPTMEAFEQEVAQRLEAQGLSVPSYSVGAIHHGSIISNSGSAHYNDWQRGDGSLLAVGDKIGDSRLAEMNPEEGWRDAGFVTFYIDDDGTQSPQDLAESVRQAYYQGVLGYEAQAVPTLDYKGEGAEAAPIVGQ